ncbi:MAG: sodium:proton antiporter [Thermomicrobiales bacterium]
MVLILSLAIGVLFMAGCYLLLKHDLIRVVAGLVLISNAANLFIMAAAIERGRAPILPFSSDTEVSDPVVQAMTLTAVVISFGVSALLLALVYRVYLAHRTVDIEDLSERDFEQFGPELIGSISEVSDDHEPFEERPS